MQHMPLLLASGSPQRRAILQELGIQFQVAPMEVDEATLDSPMETVLENARRKLTAAMAFAAPGQVVLAADTVTWMDGQVLGKPKTPERARKYLEAASGKHIQAFSSVAVSQSGSNEGWLCGETATACIRSLTSEEIEWYISTGEPLERAGAFGISHYGEIFVSHIKGSYSCIAGLPKTALLTALAQSPELINAVLPVPPLPPPKIPEDLVLRHFQID